MLDVFKSATFESRFDRLSLGNPGDVKPVGDGISELRIDYGPGYRVYFMQRGNTKASDRDVEGLERNEQWRPNDRSVSGSPGGMPPII